MPKLDDGLPLSRTQKTIRKEVEKATVQAAEDVRFLLLFVPEWAKDVPEGFGETFYGTLSAAGDREVKARVDAIRARYATGTAEPGGTAL